MLVRQQYGGGSKVLATVVMLLLMAAMLLGFYFRTQREVGPAYRPYVYAAVALLALFAWFWIRRSRASTPLTIRMDVSDAGLSVLGADADFKLPWSAFKSCLESPELFVLMDRAKTTMLMIPKRAFADEGAQAWFHTLVTNQLNLSDWPTTEPHSLAPSIPRDAVRVKTQLRFRDHLDRTLASWRLRVFFIFLTTMFAGTGVYAAMTPHPNAIRSTTEVFFLFMLPMLLVTMAIAVLLASFLAWWTHSRKAATEDIALMADSMAFSGRDGAGTVQWSADQRFKETRWSFIVWNSRTSAWIMIPKRAFSSEDDVLRCRELLRRNLQHSRWFFG
jgi:hypothetical protein